MPELPEVETTIRELKKSILGRKIEDVWSDWPKAVKNPKNFKRFKSLLKGSKIEGVERRGKNVLIRLSSKKTLLIHQKMTGHLLFGEWQLKKGEWASLIKGPLCEDPRNRFLHFILFFDNGKMLALSDLRKFAKVELLGKDELEKELRFLGPEPLDKAFTFEKFKKVLKPKKGKIKQVLMDQAVISGIGNIYSDEILWRAGINPFKKVPLLSEAELKKIFKATKKILLLAVKLRGESFSDYRTPSGEKGDFDAERKVYQREGEKCPRCSTIIKRAKIGGRSAHFCPKCQKP